VVAALEQQLHTVISPVFRVAVLSFLPLLQLEAAVVHLLLVQLDIQVQAVVVALVAVALSVAVPPEVRLPHLDKVTLAVSAL
jgi:hypothetical protein